MCIAIGGRLTRNYNRLTLAETLEKELVGEQESAGSGILGRLGLGRDKQEKK